jgi:hypothetical protein
VCSFGSKYPSRYFGLAIRRLLRVHQPCATYYLISSAHRLNQDHKAGYVGQQQVFSSGLRKIALDAFAARKSDLSYARVKQVSTAHT